ncbi:MAG: DoxX family protein [Alphaproteobacteria bacterium]
MKKICALYSQVISLSNITLSPLLDLAIRLYMAYIFFQSGWTRFQAYLDGQWEDQVYAFTEYHPIPGVPGDIAAILGTGGEVILPILLALGLFTRIGAGGLLIMTLVIQFLVQGENIANDDHYFWMLLLAVPMLKGGGMISVDFLAQKFLLKKQA